MVVSSASSLCMILGVARVFVFRLCVAIVRVDGTILAFPNDKWWSEGTNTYLHVILSTCFWSAIKEDVIVLQESISDPPGTVMSIEEWEVASIRRVAKVISRHLVSVLIYLVDSAFSIFSRELKVDVKIFVLNLRAWFVKLTESTNGVTTRYLITPKEGSASCKKGVIGVWHVDVRILWVNVESSRR